MRKSDKIIINIAVLFIYSLIFTTIVKNIIVAIFIAVLFTILTNRTFIHLHNRFYNKKTMSVLQMERAFAIMSKDQESFFLTATPPYFEPIPIENGFKIKLNCQTIAVFPNYKFSACSLDDIAKFYRNAKQNEIKTVWVLSLLNARSTILFAKGFDIEFVFIPSKKVHHFLTKQNKLPPVIAQKKVKLKKADFKEIFSNILIRKRAKYFLFSGISLGILAFLTPLKPFYLATSIICFLLCIGCLFKERA